jgi:hypothetical protein
MRFAFILAERACWPVVVMCAVLKVSASGFVKVPYKGHLQPEIGTGNAATLCTRLGNRGSGNE